MWYFIFFWKERDTSGFIKDSSSPECTENESRSLENVTDTREKIIEFYLFIVSSHYLVIFIKSSILHFALLILYFYV